MPRISLDFTDTEWAELGQATLRAAKDGGVNAFIRRAALEAAAKPKPKPRSRAHKRTAPKKA